MSISAALPIVKKLFPNFLITGSVGLWLKKELTRIPKDLDIVVSPEDWNGYICSQDKSLKALNVSLYNEIDESGNVVMKSAIKIDDLKIDVLLTLIVIYSITYNCIILLSVNFVFFIDIYY